MALPSFYCTGSWTWPRHPNSEMLWKISWQWGDRPRLWLIWQNLIFSTPPGSPCSSRPKGRSAIRVDVLSSDRPSPTQLTVFEVTGLMDYLNVEVERPNEAKLRFGSLLPSPPEAASNR